MRRREFIKLATPLTVTWPVLARAQERMRLVGFLNILDKDDPESRLRIAAFKKSLQEVGWKEDSNVRIEERYAGGDSERVRKYAKELATLAPDVILTSGSVTVRPLQQATRTIPIVFVQTVDPVGVRIRRKHVAPGWQHYRVHPVRIQLERKMA
jgi:putative ABC transport system substrate-binding protein